MTPSEIEVLIHCYVSPTPHPRKCAPDIESTLQSFVVNGLVDHVGGGVYTTTDRGRAHIAQLCATPWPVAAWVGADGKIIEE